MLFRMQSNMLFRLFPLLTAQAGFAPVDICLISENCYKTKTCPHCGKVFTPTSNRQIFCSRDCWNQARQERKEAAREAERGGHYYRQRACAVCGHSYWPTHSQQEFCSDECRRINHNRKTLEFYHKKKGNLKPDPEATPTPKPKEDNAA